MFGLAPLSGAPFGSTGSSSITLTLTGVTSSGNVGTGTPSKLQTNPGTWGYATWGYNAWGGTIVLTSAAGTGNVGSVTFGIGFSLSGVAATGNAGTARGASSVVLTGVGAAGNVGSVTQATSIPLK